MIIEGLITSKRKEWIKQEGKPDKAKLIIEVEQVENGYPLSINIYGKDITFVPEINVGNLIKAECDLISIIKRFGKTVNTKTYVNATKIFKL